MRFFLIRVITIITGVLITLSVPVVVYAQASGGAVLTLIPSAVSIGIGKNFTIQVSVDSSTAFNSASAKLTFDKDLLSVQTVSKASSALSLWAVEPSSSNADGTINFEGGNTTPLSGKKTLLTITFKTLKEGSAKVEFSGASVLAADGKGTDIAGAKNPAEFTITAGSADTKTPPSPADPSPLDRKSVV